jgi:type I restriction enzyme M protein
VFPSSNNVRLHRNVSFERHLVLGLLFLKYISDSFERRRAWLEAGTRDPANRDYFTEDEGERAGILEDRDEYISENVFWVPAETS